MTKKDYVIIARAINAHVWNNQGFKREQDLILALTDTLCQEFQAQNPRFDADKFKDECYKK